MELTTVLAKKRSLTCRTCETEFFGYTELQDDEVKNTAALYECNECNAIFSLPRESTTPLADLIKGKYCPDCDALLEESLEEKTQAGICPMCQDCDYYGDGKTEAVELETYNLDAPGK